MEINKQELGAQAKQTCAAILEALDGFTNDRFNTVPSFGGWTAGQVAEHLLLSAGVVAVIAGQVTPTTNRRPDAHLDTIAGIFLDFTTKLQSPDFIIPAAEYYDKEEMLTKIKLTWDKIGEGIRLLDLSATCLDFQFPGMGPLTRLEWISFYIWHTQRHLHQLNRIQAALVGHPRIALPVL
jgi:hypothetical protein